MIFTGLRASEARGLRWEDVDLKKGILHVRQRADRYGVVGMPKSGAGRRTVPLPPIVVNTLKEWQLACPKNDAGLVFANRAGNIEYHNNMLHRGLWVTELAAGVSVASDKVDEEGNPIMYPKYSGFHTLRHWYASWCINRKIDGGLELTPKSVQTRMGHSSIQVTFDTYGHLFPAVDEGAAVAAARRRLYSQSTRHRRDMDGISLAFSMSLENSVTPVESWFESRFPSQFSLKALNSLIFQSCRRPDAHNCSPQVMPTQKSRSGVSGGRQGQQTHGGPPRRREPYSPRQHLLLALFQGSSARR